MNVNAFRYYTFNQYLKDTFGNLRVYKIPLDAGFTCPNRDGKLGREGCIYCNNQSFSPNIRSASPFPTEGKGFRRDGAGEPATRLSISEQIKQEIEFYKQIHQADKFIAYFQSFTNTYASVGRLKEIYDQILQFPEVIGMAIGTRADCVSDEILDLIASYAEQTCQSSLGRYLVWLEYGLQSASDKTLSLIKRGHDYKAFTVAVRNTQKRNIPICAHVIIGLLGETRTDMFQTAQCVAELGIDGIKIHHLYVCRDTALAELYHQGLVKTLSVEEYIPLVCDILERLPPQMVIQRVMGELAGPGIIAPQWPASKAEVLRMIDQELERRGTRQGSRYTKV